MLPAAQTEFGSWSVDGHPIQIEYSVSILEEICATAVDGLFRFRHGGIEVGGVLFGTVDGDLVRILAFRPLPLEHAFGPRFVLSDQDRHGLKELIDAPREGTDLYGLEPVGWYHSHTRSGIELSPRDLEVYDRFFPEPWQVSLVLRPEHFGPGRAGFFFRENGRFVRCGASYEEFAVRPRRRREPAAEPAPEPVESAPEEVEAEAEPPAPVVDALPADAAPETEPEPEPEPELVTPAQLRLVEMRRPEREPIRATAPPAFTLVDARPRQKWGWLVALACLAACGAFAVERFYRHSSPAPALALWVSDVGGQLLIEWDRTSKPVRAARTGLLEIQDGEERVEIRMEGERLREGSVDYVRRSDVVDVRLRVDRDAAPPVQEYIRFVGQPVRRPADDAELTRERDELKAEVERLRQEVTRRDAIIRRLRSAQQPD